MGQRNSQPAKPSTGVFSEAEYETLKKNFTAINAAGSNFTSSLSTFMNLNSEQHVPTLAALLSLDWENIGLKPGASGVKLERNDGQQEVDFPHFMKAVGVLVRGDAMDVATVLLSAGKKVGFQNVFDFLFFCDTVASKGKAPQEAKPAVEGDETGTSSEQSAQYNTNHMVQGLQSYVGQGNEIHIGPFYTWVENCAAFVIQPFKKRIQEYLLETPTSPEQQITTDNTRSKVELRADLKFSLGCANDKFSKPWDCLFATSIDGVNFESLLYSVEFYSGPTIFVITDSLGNVFGAYTETTWKQSGEYYGDSTAMLFSLWPVYAVFRTRPGHAGGEDTENYQYLNQKSKTTEHGLGFGGTKEFFRLWLSSDLSNCKARDFGLTFANGKLRNILPDTDSDPTYETHNFKPVSIKVFGLGGAAALEEQAAERAEQLELAHGRRTVDKTQFVQSGFDKEVLLGNTFKGYNERQER